MTTETPPTPPKQRRWVFPLLILSVAANLLIIGIVAGALLSPDGPRKGGDEERRAVRGVLGEPFFRALPLKDRTAMLREIGGNRDRFREAREALRGRVEGFLAALRAESFDRAEVERLLGEQRRAAIQRQTLGEELLLNRLETMTQAERAAYADALESQLKGLRRR